MARKLAVREWWLIREEVLERDGRVCQVCGRTVIDGENYECGHIIDRCAGGEDVLENLVVMCAFCNRLKPIHETRAEYEAWTSAGGAVGEIERLIFGPV